ncbi:MAG: hypothetical protein ACE37D_01000 [Pseudomonadales bacterium]
MKVVKIGVPILLLVLIVVAMAAPIGPLPGFLIGGNDTPVPEVWQDTSELHEVSLQVPGVVPRVVIIWVIDYQSDLYVVGSSDSGWVKMLGAGGPVKLRMLDATYALTAERIARDWQPVMQAYVEKYRTDYPEIVAGFPSLEDASGQISVFRLNRS